MVPVTHPGPAMPSAAPSSSTKLWATASKEWVIPAKPKPGRKPKKEALPPQTVDDPADGEDKERKVQNRAAQRAFRERKQSQLADLQTRLQLYEQGEIERNVALQSVSKRLKEENELLKKENSRLRAELEKVKAAGYDEKEKKRQRTEEPMPHIESQPHKRAKRVEASGSTLVKSGIADLLQHENIPTNTLLNAVNADVWNNFSRSLSPPNSNEMALDTTKLMSPAPDSSSLLVIAQPPTQSNTPTQVMHCGFCSDSTPCVCRELALQQLPPAPLSGEERFKSGSRDPSSESRISVLDNLPDFAPAVPLKRRNAPKSGNTSIFRWEPASNKLVAQCSGDPQNCAACADDPFGQAFCAALEDVAESSRSCVDCPNGGSCGSSPASSENGASPNPTIRLSPAPDQRGTVEELEPETMPREEAWRQIKSHPFAPFADLRFLAEVVSRRSSCPGPSLEGSDAAGPSRTSPALCKSEEDPDSENAVLLTDPHAQYNEQHEAAFSTTTPPSLVPQDVLIRCGRERRLQVRTEGVRDALRLLDSRFASNNYF